MNTKILETLEFKKIKELFAPYLLTEQGQLELGLLLPTSKKETVASAFSGNERYAADFLCSIPHF